MFLLNVIRPNYLFSIQRSIIVCLHCNQQIRIFSSVKFRSSQRGKMSKRHTLSRENVNPTIFDWNYQVSKHHIKNVFVASQITSTAENIHFQIVSMHRSVFHRRNQPNKEICNIWGKLPQLIWIRIFYAARAKNNNKKIE